MNVQKERHQDVSNAHAFKKLAWIMGGLFAVAFFAAIYYGMKSNNLTAEKYNLGVNLDQLDEQKLKLESELTHLDSNFQSQISENSNLSVMLEERVTEVEDLKARVWNAKQKLSKSEAENEKINEHLAQLEEIKLELESDIAALNETNLELITNNKKMANDLQMTKEETAALSSQLQEVSQQNEALVKRLYTLAPAGFVANNFSVTAARKNAKLTAKANQADKIHVSFDINDVPKEYQNKEEIYLVLTQFDGKAVEALPTNEIEVASMNPVTINVVDRKVAQLKDRQNIEMSFATDNDLESGIYNVLVYADHGFLGSTTFQLR